MTEAEWAAGEDPARMLEFVREAASHRKLRLFACACCRRIWHLAADGNGVFFAEGLLIHFQKQEK